MKQKTIQEQYILLKEGKSASIDFLNKAKREFPNLIKGNTSLKDTEAILKSNHLINENYMDLNPMIVGETKPKESWENSFQNFLKENKEETKADSNKVSKYVEDSYNKNYGTNSKQHPNKISFQQYLNGVYFESHNEKNSEKNLEEVIEIVNKNLEKDFQYYLKNQYKGVEGIGLTSMNEPKEPKGKYASSGYGDLDKDTKSLIKEDLGLNKGLMNMITEGLGDGGVKKKTYELDITSIESFKKMLAQYFPDKFKYDLDYYIDWFNREIRPNLNESFKNSTLTFDRLNLQDKFKNYENDKYKVVKFAYDDEGTNGFYLLDLINKKILSYQLNSGNIIFNKFDTLSQEKNNIGENFTQDNYESNEYKSSNKSGLLVSVNPEDINSFENWLDQSPFYAEKEGDGVYFFEEASENLDNLEKFLQIEMAAEDISVQFEGQEDNLSEGIFDSAPKNLQEVKERFIPHVQLHENIEEGDEVIYDGEKYKIEKISDDGRVYIYPSEESKLLGRLPSVWVYPEDLEIKGSLNENQNMNLQQKLKEIERGGVVASLESKINAIQEEIDSRQEKINTVSENESLSEFVDKNQLKGLEKEIKELEKHKAKLEKTLDKANGGKKPKKQVVDEDNDVNDDESVEESYYEHDDERYWDEKDDNDYEAAYDEMNDEASETDDDLWADDNEYLGGEHDFKNHPIQERYSVNDKIDFLSGIRYPEQQDMLEFGNLDKLSPKTIQTLFESYFPHLNNKKIIKG